MLLELDPSVIHGINYMGLSSLDLVPNENIDMRILLLNSGGLHTIHGIARYRIAFTRIVFDISRIPILESI